MRLKHYFFLLFIPLLSGCYYPENMPTAQKGVIDLRNWDFEKDKNVELNGEWEFYWNEILQPYEFKSDSTLHERKEFVKVPDIWSKRNENPRPSKGYATYRLTVLLKNQKYLYGIKLVDCGTAYKLFIDDSLIAYNGIVSKTADRAKAQYLPLIKSFVTEPDHNPFIKLQILIQCSNYQHVKAGLWEPVKIGLYEDVFKAWKFNYSIHTILTAAIFMIFALHMLLFAMRKTEKEHLYFGIFALLIFIRNLTVDIRQLFEWFPDFNFEIYEKIEYLSAYTTPIVLGLFFYYTFKQDFHKIVIKGIRIYGLVLALSVLALPLYYFSQLKIFYNLYILLTGFYVTFYLLPIAIIRKRKYAQLLLFGVISLFVAAVFDILRSSQVVHFFYLTPLALFIYMCIQSIVLAHKFSLMYYQNEKLVLRLNFQNRNLGSIVEKRTEEIIEKNKQLEDLLTAKENLLLVQIENAQLKEDELKKNLKLKEKELATHTLLMVQKQNLIHDFIEKLKEIKKTSSRDTSNKIKQIESQINNIYRVEDSWKDFITSFEQVHLDFFNNLQIKYPDLTAGELKLCALTRLNLNIKETASLLNISPNSVKVARHRLKKKMGLNPDQSLSTYFANIEMTER